MSEVPIPPQPKATDRPGWMVNSVEDTPGYGVDGREAFVDAAKRFKDGAIAVSDQVTVEKLPEPKTLSGQPDIPNSGPDWFSNKPSELTAVEYNPGVTQEDTRVNEHTGPLQPLPTPRTNMPIEGNFDFTAPARPPIAAPHSDEWFK